MKCFPTGFEVLGAPAILPRPPGGRLGPLWEPLIKIYKGWYSFQIHVVDETRLYASWTDAAAKDASEVDKNTGIIAAKNALNLLHDHLGEEGFSQVFVDQMSEDIVAVTRHNPINHETVILVSFTAFRQPGGCTPVQPGVRNLRVEGQLAEIILEARFVSKKSEWVDL